MLYVRPVIALKETSAKVFPVNIVKILRTSIFKKICKQLLLQFLLLLLVFFPRGFLLLLIEYLSSWFCLRFKEFSLGCLVVDSYLIRKKEEVA